MFVLELTNCIILFYLVSFLLAIVHYLYMSLQNKKMKTDRPARHNVDEMSEDNS